jgi:hypothetical protein
MARCGVSPLYARTGSGLTKPSDAKGDSTIFVTNGDKRWFEWGLLRDELEELVGGDDALLHGHGLIVHDFKQKFHRAKV